MTVTTLHHPAPGPDPSANLLTLAQVAAHPDSPLRSRGRVNRAVTAELLHAHRPPGTLRHSVPEVCVRIWAAGGDIDEQIKACPLCAARRPPPTSPRRRRGT